MPTIAEIIAARSKSTPPPAAKTIAPLPPVQRESLAEQIETNDAINRIDPPGKRRGGLILDSKPEPKPAAQPAPQDPRALGARVGEALTVLPVDATKQAQAWDEIQNRWSTDLIIIEDPEPDSEAAWIGLKPATGDALPVLLHKLPFWPHPLRKQPDNQPF